MSRERHFSKVTRGDLEISGRIPYLSIDVVKRDGNNIACRVDLNLGEGREGEVGGGTRKFGGY